MDIIKDYDVEAVVERGYNVMARIINHEKNEILKSMETIKNQKE